MADNTSATGGYLQAVTAPNEGRSLDGLFRSLLAGLTGISGTIGLIRALWQPSPPTIPEPTVNWLAFGIQSITPEAGQSHLAFEEVTAGQVTTEQGRMSTHESIEVLVQCYGPSCIIYANGIRDALQLGQNREELFLAGMAFTGASSVRRSPEQVQDGRWYDRADITLTFRRHAERTYRVLSFVQAVGDINSNDFATEIPT